MFNKTMMFISSYIPLYLLLILKNIIERITDGGVFLKLSDVWRQAVFFDEINDWAVLVLILLSLMSCVYLHKVLKRSGGNKRYEVISSRDETGNYYFSYISVYLLSCLGLTLNSIVDCFVFIFIMSIIGIVYVKNDLMYLNPVINLMGYKVYDCTLQSINTDNERFESIVILKTTKESNMIKEGYCIKGSYKNHFIVAEETKHE